MEDKLLFVLLFETQKKKKMFLFWLATWKF